VNVDMALAAVCLQLRLPPDAPFVLFAMGRMAGWMAHAMEQSASGIMIRPRANYPGTPQD
jgi:citrate synthase